MNIKQDIRKKVDFATSQRMMENIWKTEKTIQQGIEERLWESREKAINALSEMVIKASEEREMSLWDICFTMVPHIEYDSEFDEENMRANIVANARLVPLEKDFEHGPNYWEKKYFELKGKIKDLLKEDADQP